MSELRGPWICPFSESLFSELLLSESLSSESLTSESLSSESLSRGESQTECGASLHPCPFSESLVSEFPPSEDPCFRNAHLVYEQSRSYLAFFRALLASTWGHSSQIPVLAAIWRHPKTPKLPLSSAPRTMVSLSGARTKLVQPQMGETKREKRQLVEAFRRFLQIWSLICKVSGLEAQKTAENHRKPQETARNRRKQFRPLSPI